MLRNLLKVWRLNEAHESIESNYLSTTIRAQRFFQQLHKTNNDMWPSCQTQPTHKIVNVIASLLTFRPKSVWLNINLVNLVIFGQSSHPKPNIFSPLFLRQNNLNRWYFGEGNQLNGFPLGVSRTQFLKHWVARDDSRKAGANNGSPGA